MKNGRRLGRWAIFGAVAGMTVLVGGNHAATWCSSAGIGRYVYEACDGEVIYMEASSRTHYIFPDRSYDDLANKKEVTTEDIEYLIDRYVELHPESALKGCAQAFIDASNETGLDPLFFLALCGIESGWGTNESHVEQSNPYSLGMFGDGVHTGYEVAETFYDGIVEGAKYIYQTYYKTGQTTLYLMNHTRGHCYCDGDPDWEYQVGSQMAYMEKLLEDRS